MKTLIALIALAVSSVAFAAEPAKVEAKPAAKTKKETPDESRKIFEAHVKEAASVVKTENSQENTRTTQIAKMDT